MLLRNKKIRQTILPALLASVAFAGLPSGAVAEPARNFAEYPNIFRAFEENTNGIEGFTDIDRSHVYSVNGTVSVSDVSRLPTLDRDTTLWGEFDAISWPFYLTASDLGSNLKVSLVFQNAASVMPELSSLDLLVNGVKLGETILQNPANPGSLIVEVPASALTVGHNALTVTARQFHRVDCSADATYELWTRIDTERSTIEYPGTNERIRSFADVAGVPADRNQALPVRIHYPGAEVLAPWDARSRQYFELVQKAAIVRGLRKSDVRVASPEAIRSGEFALDIFTGTVEELNATSTITRLYDTSGIAARVNAADSNTVFLQSRNKRRTLMLRLSEIAHLPEAFEAFRTQPLTGSRQGIALAQMQAFRTFEDTTVAMRELGYLEHEFVGRRFNTTFGFRLPADFFPGSYDEISLHLFGLYSAGLKSGQRLLIRINGQSEVSLPLNGKRGGVFEDKIVELDLARFQPGYNEIEITAFLEKPSDDVCIPGGERDMDPRFFLSADSFLSIPKLAHLGRFPNVGTTLGTGFPYRQGDERGELDVVLADDQPQTLGKAIEFVAAMAAQSDHIYNVRPRLNASVAQDGFARNRIIVGNYNALPKEYAQRINGANMTQIATYWSNPNLAVASADLDLMKTSALTDSGAAGSVLNLESAIPSGGTVDLLGRDVTGQSGISMRQRFQRQAQERRESSALDMFADRIGKVISKPIRAFRPVEVEQVPVSDTASAVLSQIVEGDTLTTVVGYAETASATANISSFFRTNGYSDDMVETAGLQVADSAITSVTINRPQLNVLRDYSVRNIRLIIAGWLSNNPAFYGGLTLFAFLIAGLLSHIALQRTQRTSGSDFEHLNM